jgi:hypothetical protein
MRWKFPWARSSRAFTTRWPSFATVRGQKDISTSEPFVAKLRFTYRT